MYTKYVLLSVTVMKMVGLNSVYFVTSYLSFTQIKSVTAQNTEELKNTNTQSNHEKICD
jgi:hypothetical protein